MVDIAGQVLGIMISVLTLIKFALASTMLFKSFHYLVLPLLV